MNKSVSWRSSTTFGRVCCMLGSIKLAIPVLTVVIAAMIRGTWIESTTSGENARALVYGSWWFIALMVLFCVILVAAVITRYPWKRRHTGFIVVHASLITIVFGGFWSLFERIEGQVLLQEGMSSNILETNRNQVEEVLVQGGRLVTQAATRVTPKTRSTLLGQSKLTIVDHWKNTKEVSELLNDNPSHFQVVHLVDTLSRQDFWIPETRDERGWFEIGNIQVRLMPAGMAYTPPMASGRDDYFFLVDGEPVTIPQEGEQLIPGWIVQSVQRFENALFTPGKGLEESTESDRSNPAIQIILDDGKGTFERHIVFKNFDEIFTTTLQGTARSGVTLHDPATTDRERLVFESIDGKLQATHVSTDGTVSIIPEPDRLSDDLPWMISIEGRSLTLIDYYDHARPSTRLEEAPTSDGNMPSLVVRLEGAPDEDIVLRWKQPREIQIGGTTKTLVYGPIRTRLPFTIKLDDFRKIDYPGSQMAMAYESDITVTTEQGIEQFNVYMNHPYKFGAWKAYQASFIGDSISIFSVMKDPGLPVTYIGCIGLCTGIFLIFYVGRYTYGHPGIPAPIPAPNTASSTANKDNSNATPPRTAANSALGNVFASKASDGYTAMARASRLDADPTQRANHADGHLRQGGGSRTDGTIDVVGQTST